MSDASEWGMRNVAAELVDFYDLLVALVASLPIPISLPSGPAYDSKEIVPAVRRVVEIINDQPVSDEVKAGVWGVCLHWLSAAEMFTLLTARGWDEIRAQQALINLTAASVALEGLEEVLREQE